MSSAVLVLLAALAAPAVTEYEAEVQAWRDRRQARLKADGGWLTVAGLFWLKEGENPFGADKANVVVLPAGSAPARAGVFELRGGKARVRLEPGVAATVGGKPVTTLDLKPDSSGSPDVIVLGRLTMHVIERGGRFAIRLKDNESEARKSFTGLRWFPIQPSYRVAARWVAHAKPAKLPIPNVLGTVEEMESPGYALFTLGGRELQLHPVLEEPGATELFFIFKDATSGKETYGAGRFLYAELPEDGVVILDFNKAYSPPCAFTPYATCPLPPRQNRLTVRIEAGEMTTGHH